MVATDTRMAVDQSATEKSSTERAEAERAEAERAARPIPVDAASRAAWEIAATVCDPEVPVLTIEDLGVLRRVTVLTDAVGLPTAVEVEITPTYSGCPAVDAIRDDVTAALTLHGYRNVTVTMVLAPAWTTDWMSEAGRTKLEQFGIAPPQPRDAGGPVSLGLGIRCPHCGSLHTRELSRFGSTSCKALYVCQRCQEPFDYFKSH
ncbi:1,2-phenylacetyl-CoA epoxidase subunit PaaD [Glaciibacter psychrotolerans]|uniref:Ring-1,2-phenylacetyl-CoA epoxidase subunit PaaD n=1 Tax=Glaciibacter psychrotolerans TaxID=670054 RepID=A0A7Z0EGM9_9MICO|nr:1,2-phenylacetyl-CoA epoxidase subunit PaaD [Leifsonia psychrotolerans]NYJ20549.1 ring-1,2-phenylacetyl-CoA epoxidase subunit PaaD [Leifsonia psychrotolerans]